MEVDTFYVLDFDRCLGRTEKFQELLEEAIAREGVVDLGMIQYAHNEVKKTGGSFDTAAYVRQVLKDQRLDVNRIWGKIEADFIQAAREEDMFEPYARQLLEVLDQRNLAFGILTYGGFEWQTAKLKAAGLLEVPHIITSYKEKGRIIAGWQRADKRFLIPEEFGTTITARHVVLIDDKPVSFTGLPPEAKGICVSPQAGRREIEALPPNITVVEGLDQALKVLFE